MLRGKYKLICFFVAAVLLDMAVAVFRMFSISLWLWIVPALYFVLTAWALVRVKTIKPFFPCLCRPPEFFSDVACRHQGISYCSDTGPKQNGAFQRQPWLGCGKDEDIVKIIK